MSSRDPVLLPDAAEAMLRDWPAPEHDREHWENAAALAVSRLTDPSTACIDETLLAPPLPAGPDEGTLGDSEPTSGATAAAVERLGETQAEPEQSKRRAPRGGSGLSLADMARASLKSADEHQSAKSIVKQSLMHLKEERHTGAMADAVAAAASLRDPEPAQHPRTVFDIGEARARRSRAPGRKAATGDDRRTGQLAAVAMVLVSLAAAAVVWVRASSRDAQPEMAARPVSTAAMSAEEASPDDESERTASQEQAATEGDAVSAAELPMLSDQERPWRHGRRPRAKGMAGGKPSRRHTAKATGPAQSPVAKPPQPLAPMAEGAGAAESAQDAHDMRPALDEAMPIEPSTGQISASLGSVLGPARRCVIGQEQASSATITFASNGRVRQVLVSGPAAGTAAERCIQSALSQARVSRFARPSFTIRGIRIRP